MSGRNTAVHRFNPAAELLSYYSEKTARILAKYGPGPRVHFHTGLGARVLPDDATRDEIRAAMVESQEKLLSRVHVSGETLLDVGCGLGGGAIFFAERRAKVTAITIVPEHVDLVKKLALAAGVSAHVTAMVRDAHDLSRLGTFDAAIAIESSCYFDRARWFAELRTVLPVGARVHVVDCFEGHPSVSCRFDEYWRTRIGTFESYDDAAHMAGFARISCEDLGSDTLRFWTLSRRWTSMCETDEARRDKSMREHAWLARAIDEGAVRYLSVAFRRAR